MPEVRDGHWDRVKVILTQPFRKDRQMGLSLLRVVGKDVETEQKNKQSGVRSREPLFGKSSLTIFPICQASYTLKSGA